MRKLFWFDLPGPNGGACFGAVAVSGLVAEVAPLARWSLRKPIRSLVSWVLGNGGQVLALADDTWQEVR